MAGAGQAEGLPFWVPEVPRNSHFGRSGGAEEATARHLRDWRTDGERTNFRKFPRLPK